MVVINKATTGIGMEIRKKLGRTSIYGQRIYGFFEYGETNLKYGVYQVRTRSGEHIAVREKFYIPTNPQSGPQQANRSVFADAVAAWQALTDPQKAVYNKSAKYKNYSGYNLYISEYMLSH